MMQLRAALDHGAARLSAGPHPERASRDAEILLIHLTGKNRAWLVAHGTDEVGGCTAIGYANLLERRFAGEPIQYITGEVEFFGLPFHVTRDVLIPRPETEHLVEKAIAIAAEFPSPRIVDIGTGSGAISVALAHHVPDSHITAIDLSPAALRIAEGNAHLNGVAERVRFLVGDLLAPVADESFDIVVSNPPYVPERDGPSLAVEVRAYEPELALFGGFDGLEKYRRLIPAAALALRAGGYLVLEIGFGQEKAVNQLLRANGYQRIDGSPDLQGITRVLCGQRR